MSSEVLLKMWVHVTYFEGGGLLPRKPIKMLLVETCRCSFGVSHGSCSSPLPCLMLICKEHIWRWELFFWPLREGVASKNIHTVGRQKE